MSQPKRVRIQVTRDDGDSILMDGVAGLAIAMQADVMPTVPKDPTVEDLMRALPDLPLIALRADNAYQLAIMLGGLIGTIRDFAGPECIATAFRLSTLIDAANPQMVRELPKRHTPHA